MMVLILTGPPAAGKTTVGPLLAQRLRRCTVIDVDQLRRMVVQPHIAPWKDAEGLAQLQLGARNASLLVRNFVAEGYAVIVLDVLIDETAALYKQLLADIEYRIVLLLPSLGAVIERNQRRGQWLTDDEVRLLYRWEEKLTIYDEVIDNTVISPTALASHLQKLYFAEKSDEEVSS
jgi:shikimate kinase